MEHKGIIVENVYKSFGREAVLEAGGPFVTKNYKQTVELKEHKVNGGFILEEGLPEEAAHETERLIIRLRYGGLACVLALLLGRQLFKAGSREQERL